MKRKKVKNKVLIAIVLLLILALSGYGFGNYKETTMDSYTVVHVSDGDTIIVDISGEEEKIRLIGVDAPESVHPDSSRNTEIGSEVSDVLKNLLTEKNVTLEYDLMKRDKYGRLLAYVYLDSEMINEYLIKNGYAKVYTVPPNVKYEDRFITLEREAQIKKKGIWRV